MQGLDRFRRASLPALILIIMFAREIITLDSQLRVLGTSSYAEVQRIFMSKLQK